MSGYSAGEARLAIVPDTSAFRRKLEDDMRKINAEFALKVTANTAQARADINRLREVEQRNGMRLGVDVELAKADAQMAAFRARQRVNDVKVKVDADTGGALQQVEKLGDAFGNITSTLGKGLKFSLAFAGIGELPAATLALTQMVGAVQQLAQAGLAIPGVFAGIGASFGTLALGLSGVKDAYDAVTKAATTSGQDQAQHAREVTSATNAHRNAVVDEAQAERDRTRAVKDASYALQDLNLQLRGGKISEQQAINNALRQRRDLQKDLATGQIKDQLDLQQRLLDIESADQSVAEAHQRNIELQDKVSDANQKGIANSDQVVAANERVTRSQQAVEQTADALAAATSNQSASAQAASLAMSQLSPNAKDFVDTLVGMKGQFDDLRNTVQDNLFAGMSQNIKDLVAADLPTLKTGLAGIATAWNGTLTQLTKSLGSDSSKGLLDRILGDTAKAQRNFTAAIDPLVHGIGVLTAAGADALPRLADDLKSVADRFNGFISAAAEDGRLDKWISDGITGFEHIGNTLLNVGDAITAITRAAGGGEGLLGMLETGSRKLADFLNSVEGQNKLKEWFEEGRREIQEHIIPLLQALPAVFSGFVDAGRIIANSVLPPLTSIMKFLSEDIPGGIKTVVGVFVAWKGITGVASLIDDIKTIKTTLTDLTDVAKTAAAGISTALGSVTVPAWVTALGALAAPAAGAAATAGTVGAQWLSILDQIRNPEKYKDVYQNPHPSGVAAKASGGPIVGGVPGRDSVPIMAMPGEHMLTTSDVAAMGGQANVYAFRRALHGYAGGGEIVDPYGNPVAPGMLPGPSQDPSAPIAPNPTAGGGGQIVNSILSGLGGPISNLTSLTGMIPGVGGGQGATGVVRPGLLGLLDAGGNPNLLSAWGQQTGNWLGQFGAKTATSFATTLYTGALDFFGLGNSILSPTNPWFQAGAKSLGVLNGFFPGGTGGLDGGTPQLGSQSIQLGDGSTIEVPTFGTSVTPEGATVSAPTSSAPASVVPSGSGAERWRPAVREALQKYGPQFGITNFKAWEDAMVRQINTESGGNPGADNPNDTNGRGGTQHVSGIGQFLRSTFDANNITGGDYLDPYAQIAAMIPYVARKYGMDGSGAPLQIGRGVGYASGGAAVGPGGPTSDQIPTLLSNGEHVLTAADVNAMGGQGAVYAFRNALHRAAGGPVTAYVKPVVPSPPPPRPQVPDIRRINTPPPRGAAVIPSAPTTPLPGPVQAPTTPAPVVAPPDQPPTQQQQQKYQGPAAVAPAPSDLNHNLAAINTGITSGFATAGNLAATAISTAAAAGTFGAAGAAGGGAGSLVAGLFNEAGKIATDIVNVGSSFLVGNVTAGTAPTAYGELNLAPQNVPVTAPDNRRSYVFNGVDGRNIVDDIRLKDAQDMQAQLSNF